MFMCVFMCLRVHVRVCVHMYMGIHGVCVCGFSASYIRNVIIIIGPKST